MGLLGVSPGWADCPLTRVDEQARLASVYDGDSLRLEDGRRVRVLGINTPEMALKGQPAEPLSVEAKEAAKVFLARGEIQLTYERQKKDKYGRILAHVYDEKGRSLAAHLLASGLAFHIAIPPNLGASDCLYQQEASARRSQKGIWRHSYWAPRSARGLTLRDTGFRRISGRVVNITEGRGSIWVELDGPVVLRIAAADKSRFTQHAWRGWQGKRLEARGWIIDRSQGSSAKKGFKPLLLQVRTPYAIKIEEGRSASLPGVGAH